MHLKNYQTSSQEGPRVHHTSGERESGKILVKIKEWINKMEESF